MNKAVLALVILTSTSLNAATYHIGNSLTWDAIYTSNALAGNVPEFSERGYHIRCGASLPYIWANQTEVCTPSPSPYGTISNIESSTWEAVTIQPFPGSTLAVDTAVIDNIIDKTRTNAENANTTFYIYATWPQKPLGPYTTVWAADVVDADGTPMLQQRGYYDALYNRVDAVTDAVVRYIPSGEVLYQLGKLIEVDALPGVTSMDQFYRDDLHLSGLGQYVTSTTMFSLLNKVNPASVWPTMPVDAPGVDFALINQTILDVVTHDVRSGLTDFNDDGLVDESDMVVWASGDVSADANLDGVVDGQDFLLWQQQATVTSVVAPPIVAVPEPAAAVLAIFLLGLPCYKSESPNHRSRTLGTFAQSTGYMVFKEDELDN